jgi:diguanylate cyclase (GGDEF)-like protein
MNSGEELGLLMLDLDHFKHVNDTLGHAAGDQLLSSFTERLEGAVRSGDFMARLGGDEFAVIIENVRGPGELIAIGTSILSRLAEPIAAGAHFVRASASIGGALFPKDSSSAAELMSCADTALYALKGAGRGGTKLFEADLRQELQRAASELRLGRAAINERRIVPYYQPKVDLHSGRTVGFEALLRWVTPRRVVQLPGTVAESFKNYELAAQIGDTMQRSVLKAIASGILGSSGGHVAINAAPAEFLRDDYSERLLNLLDDTGISREAIQVEVTEHVFFERHAGLVKRALQNLHENGVRIALDDFGTGYSSLSHLRDFPVDVLKVDMSFIQQMCAEPEIKAIVAAVIDLARNLKIDVVAEGVETEEQRLELIRLGCTYGQGYYFGRPLPLASILPRSGLKSKAA